MTDTARCRSCQAPIRFGLTAKGKRMPLDLEPVTWETLVVERSLNPRGPERDDLRGLQVFDGRIRQATIEDVSAGRELFRPHFATCPDAGRFRR